jgi:hypothetical protein
MNIKNIFKWLSSIVLASMMAVLMTSCFEGSGTIPDPCASGTGGGGESQAAQSKSVTPPPSQEELTANRNRFIERMDRSAEAK